MTTLPESLVNKIMQYHSHPVADLFKDQVSFMPGVIERDPDVILIGVHNRNYMYSDSAWFSKEHECQYYSDKMEEFVVCNMLKSKLDKLKTYDTFNCSIFKMINYMFRNLDPTFKHLHSKPIRKLSLDYKPFFKHLAERVEEYEECWMEFHFNDGHDPDAGYYDIDEYDIDI